MSNPAERNFPVVLLAWCASAVHYLEALGRVGNPPLLVVTGEQAPAASPLGREAARLGVPIESWFDANDPRLVRALEELSPELLIVAGWPRILHEPLRSTARVATVNFHPSLLPWHRGRTPLFWSLLWGESQVGITAHRMTEELDKGPILLQRPVTVAPDDDHESLSDRVDRAGAELLTELLAQAARGSLPAGEWPDQEGSYTERVRPEHGLVDWSWSARNLERLVRAARGVVEVFTFYRGMKLKLVAASCSDDQQTQPPGTVLGVSARGVDVATGAGTLRVESWRFLERVLGANELAAAVGLGSGGRFAHNPILG